MINEMTLVAIAIMQLFMLDIVFRRTASVFKSMRDECLESVGRCGEEASYLAEAELTIAAKVARAEEILIECRGYHERCRRHHAECEQLSRELHFGNEAANFLTVTSQPGAPIQ